MLFADSLIVLGLATASLGTIHESDGVREHSFWLQNAGTDSVRLQQGYTSCGCTTIHFAKGQKLAPLDSTRVTLRFNPRGKGGAFQETGTVVYGNKRRHVTLTLEGNCITSEETLLRQFPIRVSDDIRLSANHFDLGVMRVGETRERGIIVLLRSEGNRQQRVPVTFTVTEKTPKGLQHIEKAVQIGNERIIVKLDVMVK